MVERCFVIYIKIHSIIKKVLGAIVKIVVSVRFRAEPGIDGDVFAIKG
jgi:hypothetical protein